MRTYRHHNIQAMPDVMEKTTTQRRKKERKMKKTIFTGCLLLCLGMFLSSCGFSRSNASPGSVLGAKGSNQKVVTFNVTGKGLEPEKALTRGEAILMAERAAISDGYRQLVEKIRGVYVEAYSKSGNGSIDYDLINTQTNSWLRGVKIVNIEQAAYGITKAHMQLSIYFAKRDMIWWPMGLGNEVYVKEGLFSTQIVQ